MPNVWTMHAQSKRLDLDAIKGQVNIEAVAVAMLGPPAKRHGDRLWWVCPLHEDRNPSFAVSPGHQNWRCFGCGEHGDAVALVRKLNGTTFPEAVRTVAEICGLTSSSGTVRPKIVPRPAKAPERPPERRSGLDPPDALALVEDASKRLWNPDGSKALAYLHSRGLTDETIFAARLGYVPDASIPKASGDGTYRVSGITIPWFEGDKLVKINIRKRDGSKPKYISVFADCPRVYPGPEAIRPGSPLVVCEGEFDALLLNQQIGDVASVITLGGASSRPNPSILSAMLSASPWFIATDADDAGDRAASLWTRRAVRVRPPEGINDWTDAHKSGSNMVRYLWGRYLPMGRSTPEALAEQRWGGPEAPEDLGCVADEIGFQPISEEVQ